MVYFTDSSPIGYKCFAKSINILLFFHSDFSHFFSFSAYFSFFFHIRMSFKYYGESGDYIVIHSALDHIVDFSLTGEGNMHRDEA